MIELAAPHVEPLQAAKSLLAAIEAPKNDPHRLQVLARAIDAYVYAVGHLESDEIGRIEDAEVNIAKLDSGLFRRELSQRFPELGLYCQALHSKLTAGESGEVSLGDAIDDLLDIAEELHEVLWLHEHYGEAEALAALRFRHQSHLYMHVFPLRLHLEELLRKG